MKRLLILLIISFSIISLHGQNLSSISASYDRYFKANNDFIRKNGFTISYILEVEGNDLISINFGVSPRIIQEEYNYLEYTVILYQDTNWDSVLLGYEIPTGLTVCVDWSQQ